MIIIIFMKSSVDRDNNYCRYVIFYEKPVRKYVILSSGRMCSLYELQALASVFWLMVVIRRVLRFIKGSSCPYDCDGL
jgi:hypothetical protein